MATDNTHGQLATIDGHLLRLACETRQHAEQLAADINATAWAEIERL